MKKCNIVLFVSSIISLSGFAQTNEPIIMTIKDKPVYKSEFENVFKKNNGRDFNKEPKSLREYLDLL